MHYRPCSLGGRGVLLTVFTGREGCTTDCVHCEWCTTDRAYWEWGMYYIPCSFGGVLLTVFIGRGEGCTTDRVHWGCTTDRVHWGVYY